MWSEWNIEISKHYVEINFQISKCKRVKNVPIMRQIFNHNLILSAFNSKFLYWKCSDGIEVSPKLIGPTKLEWESGYPDTDNTNQTCVAWSGHTGLLKMRNTMCDSREEESILGTHSYYDKDLGQLYNETQLLRGYLCETRAIHTVTAYGSSVNTYSCILIICNKGFPAQIKNFTRYLQKS